ncbi:MAG: acetylglutamate kinase [Gemmatimonadaceae bacterium]
MTIVIKLGGRVQSDHRLANALNRLWNANEGAVCIVHGGGDEVSALQRQLGREPEFVNGRRVTTEEDLELVRMVLSGSANKRLVAMLTSAGLPAAGISGEDGGLLPAIPIDARLGRAGKPITPGTSLIRTLLAAGFLPVISPVATDSTSTFRAPLNVNGDDAAAAIAAALGAELWMIADVDGVLDAGRAVIQRISAAQLPSLVAAGTVNKGMHAKLEAGFAALEAGAPGVRITSIEGLSSAKAGTSLSLT